MLHQIYRKIIPIGLRYIIANLRTAKKNSRILSSLTEKYQRGDYELAHKQEIEYMLKKHKIEVFPYAWIEEYSAKIVEVCTDTDKKMHYVMHHGKRLYFPKGYSKRFIRYYYLSLVMEQDSRSPHCYFKDDTTCLVDSIFIDVGAAEGIIALDIIETVKQAVLFECNVEWVKALKETFAPWSEKVTVVSKFVGKVSTGIDSINLDEYYGDIESGTRFVLKMDVEGNEKDVLKGADKMLRSSITDLFVCTYHRKEDYETLKDMIQSYGFQQEHSEGWMFYGEEPESGFRHGLIRAHRGKGYI